MKLQCIACMDCATSSNNNLGDARKETGFFPLLSHLGEVHWLCIDHQRKAQDAMRRLVSALGEDEERVSWMHLPNLLQLMREVR